MIQSKRDIFVGLRKEDKSYWERRTPLPPQTCKQIMDQHDRIQILVQPCSGRIFTNKEYEDVGCILQNDLSKCSVIVCIKEIPLEKYIPGMTYIHWSHIIKAQPANMAALDKMLELGVRQLDYEKIYDESGVNITAFPYAGIAGVITFFSEYGKYLLQQGINNPFLCIGPAYQYYNIESAYRQLREVGDLIKNKGLSPNIRLPITVAVLGSSGCCGHGSMQALQNLAITIIQPDDLPDLYNNPSNPKHANTIYVIPFQTKHLVRCSKDYDREFTSQEYYDNPSAFTPVFHSKYLPYISIIINDIYWDHKFPRYITNHQIKDLVQSGQSRLQGVCDVTCDFEGSIQFLKKFTTPDDPIYYYNPIDQSVSNKLQLNHPQILYMSIDFLPSQLPYDASVHFGKLLVDIVPQIAYSDPKKSLQESGLPPYLQAATITLHGSLTPNYQYIQKLRALNEDLKQRQNFQPKKALKKVASYLSISIEGHLFDKGIISEILNHLEQIGVKFNIVDLKAGNNTQERSSAIIQLFSKSPNSLSESISKIIEICQKHDCKFSQD